MITVIVYNKEEITMRDTSTVTPIIMKCKINSQKGNGIIVNTFKFSLIDSALHNDPELMDDGMIKIQKPIHTPQVKYIRGNIPPSSIVNKEKESFRITKMISENLSDPYYIEICNRDVSKVIVKFTSLIKDGVGIFINVHRKRSMIVQALFEKIGAELDVYNYYTVTEFDTPHYIARHVKTASRYMLQFIHSGSYEALVNFYSIINTLHEDGKI